MYLLSDEQLQRIESFRAEHNEPVELCDIAIVLLGVRMGLRAYDIMALSFQDIDWKNRQISIVMKKTKTQITLPMPIEVGNAIYSYITSGRPKANIEYIFVRSKAPYGKLTGKVCTNALYRILPERKDVKGGGFHVTRRTFATNLLRNHAEIDDVVDYPWTVPGSSWKEVWHEDQWISVKKLFCTVHSTVYTGKTRCWFYI